MTPISYAQVFLSTKNLTLNKCLILFVVAHILLLREVGWFKFPLWSAYYYLWRSVDVCCIVDQTLHYICISIPCSSFQRSHSVLKRHNHNCNNYYGHFKTIPRRDIKIMCKMKNREEYRGMFEVNSPQQIASSSGKGLVSTRRTYASPEGDGTRCPGSKCPLSACCTRCKSSMETGKVGKRSIFVNSSQIYMKSDRWRAVIVFGQATYTECHLAFLR